VRNDELEHGVEVVEVEEGRLDPQSIKSAARETRRYAITLVRIRICNEFRVLSTPRRMERIWSSNYDFLCGYHQKQK
jgi:hypothetical protein